MMWYTQKQMSMTRDFETLKTKMDEEAALQVDSVKRLVWRLRGTYEATLFIPKVEKKEPTSKKLKIRGHYTNWFEPSLWDPIFAAVRKHRKYQQCMQVLEDDVQETGRELWYLRSRSNMYEWFTSTGELKDVYKKYVDEGSSHF